MRRDACRSMAIMLSPLRFGGVCGLRRHLHPVDVARAVMERTEHRLLCGEDADDFADRHGIPAAELLSEEARSSTWSSWQARGDSAEVDQSKDSALLGLRPVDPGLGSDAAGGSFDRPATPGGGGPGRSRHHLRPRPGRRRHPRRGLLHQRASVQGARSGGGLADRGPRPLRGARDRTGDGDGNGELISGICASMVAVEAMRRGASPHDAVRETLERVERLGDLRPHHQVGVVVMDAEGRIASGGFRPGFLIAVRDADGGRIVEPDIVLRPDDEGLGIRHRWFRAVEPAGEIESNSQQPEDRSMKLYTRTGDDGKTGLFSETGSARTIPGSRRTEPSTS